MKREKSKTLGLSLNTQAKASALSDSRGPRTKDNNPVRVLKANPFALIGISQLQRGSMYGRRISINRESLNLSRSSEPGNTRNPQAHYDSSSLDSGEKNYIIRK